MRLPLRENCRLIITAIKYTQTTRSIAIGAPSLQGTQSYGLPAAFILRVPPLQEDAPITAMAGRLIGLLALFVLLAAGRRGPLLRRPHVARFGREVSCPQHVVGRAARQHTALFHYPLQYDASQCDSAVRYRAVTACSVRKSCGLGACRPGLVPCERPTLTPAAPLQRQARTGPRLVTLGRRSAAS